MTKQFGIHQFREAGLLQEVNRLFFHPRGLALAVHYEKDDTGIVLDSAVLLVQDFTDEGIEFGDDRLAAEDFKARAQNVASMVKWPVRELL